MKDRLFPWVVLWLVLASLTAYMWRDNYFMCEENQRLALRELAVQDSLLQVKSDSIKVLKEQNFKLTTINSTGNE